MTTTSVTEHQTPTGCAHNTDRQGASGQDAFSTDITGLRAGVPTETVDLSDGAVFDLRVTPVIKQIGDATVRMLAYNGSIPGPTLRVRQGTQVVVNAVNDGDLETTVHWHGLRLDNRFDGTHHTQEPIEPGGASVTGSPSPTPVCTGTTRTSGRTTARKWGCTAPSSSNPPNTTTGHP